MEKGPNSVEGGNRRYYERQDEEDGGGGEREQEQTTESGIVLPDTAKEKPQTAEVVAVGAHEDVKVSVGDVVVVRKYAGTEVKLDGEDHRIVDAEDVLGVIEED